MFLNSEFLTSDFLGYNISGCLDLPFVRKYYLILAVHVFLKNVKMFLKCSGIVLEFF